MISDKMLCKRRFLKLGLKQRILIGGSLFVLILILLSNKSYDAFNFKHAPPNRHKSKHVKFYSDKLPHYPDREFNLMDREMAQMHPYLNDPGAMENPDVSEEEKLKGDRKVDFPVSSMHAHIGHVLLSSSKVTEQIRSLLLRISSPGVSSIDDVEDFLIDTADLLQDSDVRSPMSCKDIDNIQVLDLLDYTSKKLAYRGQLSLDVEVAVKNPGKDLDAKVACMEKFNNLERCTAVMNFQVVREILLHSVLRNEAIVKMLGYCIRGDELEALRKGVILVTEMGSRVEPWNLDSHSWKGKFKVLYSLAEFLVYLENSPLGSLRLEKLSGKDFVLVKDTLKLVDLDELRIGEKNCTKKEDCFAYKTDVGINCKSGQCQGLNARLNLKKVYDVLLYSLLRQEPRELKMQVYNVVEQCEILQMTPQKLLMELQQMANVRIREPEKRKLILPAEDSQEVDVNSVKNVRGTDTGQQQVPKYPIGNFGYRRVNSSNFPGMYDFVCPNSRVTWGCVLDSHGLSDSMKKCDSIQHCKAIVAFTKYPEANTLFTVVLKSAFDHSPVLQDGTTLFLKNPAPAPTHLEAKDDDTDKEKMMDQDVAKDDKQHLSAAENKVKENKGKAGRRKKPSLVLSDNPHQCSQQVLRDQKKRRRSAEKRLMTHISMKGLDERTWSDVMNLFPVIRMYPLISGTEQSDARPATGGQLIAKFAKPYPSGVRKALVTVVNGPDQYHIAHLTVYYVDRLLGLYHVPPCRVVELSPTMLETVQNEVWFEPFKAHINKDGVLKAVVSVPKPETVTQQDILITRPSTYVTNLITLSKKQRVQMEYLLVMWLSRMPQPSKGHLGYNGHLIHFEPSRALQEISQSWILNYFYNCQFPKAIVQVLNCFRCGQDSSNQSKVCSFGQEVMDHLHGAGIPYEDIKIGNKGLPDLKTILNDAASKLLNIVDNCVQLFGKSNVLY